MLGDHHRRIALAQVMTGQRSDRVEPPELSLLLERAMTPSEVHRALLKERPVLAARFDEPEATGPTPQELREEAAAVGLIDGTPEDMEYRALFPTLDHGVYCAHHAMGKPSAALLPALEEHFGGLYAYGFQVWERAGWATLRDTFRERVADVCGADLIRGDVARFECFSDGLSAILGSGVEGRMLAGADHFSTGRYVHEAWARRPGNTLVELPGDADGWVPTERYLEALTPDTAVVSLSSAHWRTGRLHDLDALRDRMSEVCPDVVFLLDGYQTLGTVPFRIDGFPMRTAVLGGGIKQLHAGTGSGFAWMSHTLLSELEPHRTGWFAHARPFDFDAPPLDPAHGAVRWQTGAPDVGPMVALSTELGVLATLGHGSLRAAIRVARERTRGAVARAMKAAVDLGLDVVGDVSAERRAAFLAIRVHGGEGLVARLAAEGVHVDHRADGPGAPTGLVRLSSAAAAYPYELVYAVERLAHAIRAR